MSSLTVSERDTLPDANMRHPRLDGGSQKKGKLVALKRDQVRDQAASAGSEHGQQRKHPISVTHPDIAAQWHPTLNEDLTPEQVIAGAGRKAFWLCERDHPWAARVSDRVNGSGCPACAGRVVVVGFNDLATTHPQVLAEWHPTLNGDLTPEKVTAGTSRKAFWICKLNHQWSARIYDRTNATGCPVCAGQTTLAGFNDLATTNPAVAAEWHTTLNGDLTPEQVTAGTNRKVFWSCKLDHSWEARITDRVVGKGCPFCVGRQVLDGFNDLTTVHPTIAAEWHPTLNGDLTPEQVTAGTNRKVFWSCKLDHSWEARITDRVAGKGCPLCVEASTSKIESRLRQLMLHSPFTEFITTDPNTRLDVPLGKYKTMTADIYGKLRATNFKGLIIEYDGKYWHEDRFERDLKKTNALLDAGYLVVRVRESGLPLLDTWHPNLLQTQADYSLKDDALIDVVIQVESFLDMHERLAAA